jgi:predicted GNAT family acetyltransferase
LNSLSGIDVFPLCSFVVNTFFNHKGSQSKSQSNTKVDYGKL